MQSADTKVMEADSKIGGKDGKIAERQFQNDLQVEKTTKFNTEIVNQDIKTMKNNEVQGAKTININLGSNTKDVKVTEMHAENDSKDEKLTKTNIDIRAQVKSKHLNSKTGVQNVEITGTHSESGAQDGETSRIDVKATNTNQAHAAITTHINSGNNNKDVRVTEIHLENDTPGGKITTTNKKVIDDGVKIINIDSKGAEEDVKATMDNKAIKPANANSSKNAEGVKSTEAHSAHSGHSVQVVTVSETHSYELDEHALQEILMNEKIKDLPVVVVSIAGATRTGKSYLLNFFIRYLTAPESARQNGLWLSEDSPPLDGFEWRSGSHKTTLGILLWSEPFILTRLSGEKVAVLLIDTQGTFDSTSTVNDCSTVFALSTLLSSVQIYNLSLNIQEDNLQFLQLFTNFGRMVKDQESTAFNVLEFLVRDWQFPWEHPYGAIGGEQLLEERLKVTPSQTEAMQEMRKNIRSSFEKVSCFLMPHPGFKIFGTERKGNISDIGIEFRTYVKELVTSLFSAEKLTPKTINGEKVKARDLFNYFKTYMTIFKSNEIPSLMSIHEAMEKANLLSIMNEAIEIYENGMDSECGPHQLSMPADYVRFLHKNYSDLARSTFTSRKKVGSKEKVDQYLGHLITELENRLPQFVQGNLVKTQTLISKANESYEKAIQNFGNVETLCVHPTDLDKIHKAGLDAALKTFDEGRKRIINRNDNERGEFVKSLLVIRSTLLEQPNQRNNDLAVSRVHLQYKERMINTINSTVLQTREEFAREHKDAKRQALEQLKTMRNNPIKYAEDIFVDKLEKAIDDSFQEYEHLNSLKKYKAMRSAVNAFSNYIKFDNYTDCWHPKHLEENISGAIYRAIYTLLPNKSPEYYEFLVSNYYIGIYGNGVLRDLLVELNYNKIDLERSNEANNNKLINDCYLLYTSIMAGYSIWSFKTKTTHYRETVDKTKKVFFSKRTDNDYASDINGSDNYALKLLNMCSRQFHS